MALFKSVTDLIGNTPLVELTNIEKLLNLKARVLAKVEGLRNVTGKWDRISFGDIHLGDPFLRQKTQK